MTDEPAALGLAITALALIGLIINLYIFVVVILTKQVEGGSVGCRLLVGHLGLVGSLSCLERLLRASLHCQAQGFVSFLLHPLALWTVCGLNADRYVAIASPLHYARYVRPSRVAGGLVVAWLLAATCATLPLASIPAPYIFSNAVLSCAPVLATTSAQLYLAFYIGFVFLLPAALVTLFNLKVLMIARYHRHRIARAIFEVTLSAQVTITHQKNPFLFGPAGLPGRSASASVLQLVGSLVLMYAPHYGLIVCEAVGGKPSKPFPPLAAVLLALAPSANALLYGLRNKLLRRTFRHYWRKKMTKSELDQEIQARTPSRRPSLTPQKVWKPTGLALRHSATSTSILNNPGKPRILVTKADETGYATSTKTCGGSSSSVESDVTQDEERWRWRKLSGSSASLPVAT